MERIYLQLLLCNAARSNVVTMPTNHKATDLTNPRTPRVRIIVWNNRELRHVWETGTSCRAGTGQHFATSSGAHTRTHTHTHTSYTMHKKCHFVSVNNFCDRNHVQRKAHSPPKFNPGGTRMQDNV